MAQRESKPTWPREMAVQVVWVVVGIVRTRERLNYAANRLPRSRFHRRIGPGRRRLLCLCSFLQAPLAVSVASERQSWDVIPIGTVATLVTTHERSVHPTLRMPARQRWIPRLHLLLHLALIIGRRDARR